MRLLAYPPFSRSTTTCYITVSGRFRLTHSQVMNIPLSKISQPIPDNACHQSLVHTGRECMHHSGPGKRECEKKGGEIMGELSGKIGAR